MPERSWRAVGSAINHNLTVSDHNSLKPRRRMTVSGSQFAVARSALFIAELNQTDHFGSLTTGTSKKRRETQTSKQQCRTLCAQLAWQNAFVMFSHFYIARTFFTLINVRTFVASGVVQTWTNSITRSTLSLKKPGTRNRVLCLITLTEIEHYE